MNIKRISSLLIICLLLFGGVIIAQDSESYYPTYYEYPYPNVVREDLLLDNYYRIKNTIMDILYQDNFMIEYSINDFRGENLGKGHFNHLIRAYRINELPDYFTDENYNDYLKDYEQKRIEYYTNRGYTQVYSKSLVNEEIKALNEDGDKQDLRIEKREKLLSENPDYFKLIYGDFYDEEGNELHPLEPAIIRLIKSKDSINKPVLTFETLMYINREHYIAVATFSRDLTDIVVRAYSYDLTDEENEVKKYDDELAKLEEQIKNFDVEIEKAGDELDKVKQEIGGLDSQIEEKNNDIENVEKSGMSNDEKDEEIERLRRERDALKEDVKRQRRRREKLEEEIERNRRKRRKLEEEAERIRRKRNPLQEEVERLKKRRPLIEKEIEKVNENHIKEEVIFEDMELKTVVGNSLYKEYRWSEPIYVSDMKNVYSITSYGDKEVILDEDSYVGEASSNESIADEVYEDDYTKYDTSYYEGEEGYFIMEAPVSSGHEGYAGQEDHIINLLGGIEYAENLNSITFNNHSIIDLSPLATLVELGEIRLSGNDIDDITPVLVLHRKGGLKPGSYIDIRYNNMNIVPNSVNRVIVEYLIDEGVNVDWKEGNKIGDFVEKKDEYPVTSARKEIPDPNLLEDLKTFFEITDDDSNLISEYHLRQADSLWFNTINPSRTSYRTPASEKISDITGLEICENLKTLNLEHQNVDDRAISIVSQLPQLKELHINGNNVSDVSGLRNMTGLERLSLGNNEIRDISMLDNLKNLIQFGIGGNPIEDISLVQNFTNLAYFHAWDTGLTNDDLVYFKDLTQLQWLSINDNNITDISELNKLTKLRDLDISYNQITDISVLLEIYNNGGFQNQITYDDIDITNNGMDLTLGTENRNVVDTLIGNGVAVTWEEGNTIN